MGRPGMYATARFALVVLAASAVALALPFPPLVALLAVNLAAVLALGVDVWVAARPDSLQAAWDMPSVLSLDRPGKATLGLRNPKGRRLRVAAHPAAAPSTGLYPPRQGAVLDPHAVGHLEVDIVPSRRGHVTVGPLTLRTGGPLGLGGRQRTLPILAHLKCYPALPGRRQAEIRLDRARLLQSGYRLSPIRGGGGEFDSLREYHPDDEFRRINWRATARSTKTISNTYREERNQQVLLLVDASRTMAGTVAGVPRFEHTLDAGIALAELAGRAGDHVGMAAFGGDVLVAAGPRSGRTQARRILDLLFDLQPSLDAANYRRVFAAVLSRYRRRALLVLLTELTDRGAMEG
ncbi:MAG TPA: DUF58 domain-containing protein, partial [Actinomycetota bacterium]|nr:DUF58 domain-containing protein [Actinomycetota bacterium]